MPRLKRTAQAIYVMELRPTGEVKIGVAQNPLARWRWLRTAVARGELRLVYVSPAATTSMWMLERLVHRRLDARRLQQPRQTVGRQDRGALVVPAKRQPGSRPNGRAFRASVEDTFGAL